MTNTKCNPAAATKAVTPKKAPVPKTPTRQTKTKAPNPEPAALIPAPAKPETKRTILIGLLQQPDGATIVQLTEWLGWLPHTVRAALTGLRKAGHTIDRTLPADGPSVYRLTVKA